MVFLFGPEVDSTEAHDDTDARTGWSEPFKTDQHTNANDDVEQAPQALAA